MSKYKSSMSNIVSNMPVPDQFSASSPAKISTKSKRAFSLPASKQFACPGETPACDGCYAMKGRHFFSNVQKAFARNWQLLKSFERNKDTDNAAEALLNMIPRSAKIFRIHESGDFHSQWAVDVWAEVVKSRKDISFWAYTRSFDFDFTKLTRNKNFVLWASTDQYNVAEAKKFVRRFRKSGVKHAYGPWEHDKDIPKSSFICPATNHRLAVEGVCEKCMLCVVKKRTNKHVVFMEH